MADHRQSTIVRFPLIYKALNHNSNRNKNSDKVLGSTSNSKLALMLYNSIHALDKRKSTKLSNDPSTEHDKNSVPKVEETIFTHKSKIEKEKGKATLNTPVKILFRSNINTEVKHMNKGQTEFMRDIQTSLDCPKIEMEEPTTTTPKADLNTQGTELSQTESKHAIVIIKTESIPVNVTMHEIQTAVAEWKIPLTNIRIGKRKIHNKVLRYATIKLEDINQCQELQHKSAILLRGKCTNSTLYVENIKQTQ